MKSFHSFRLDSINQCLWRGDERVSITPKAFDVLRYLVEHPGRLVTHEEILEALWPKAYVNPEVVKKYILAVRKALEDRAQSARFVETVPRRGYQFVAQVIEEGAARSDGSDMAADTSLVGRNGALAKLDELMDKSVKGQRQIVFVTGEPGIGKTALIDAFYQRAERRFRLRIGRGQCVEGFGGKEPYYPMLEAIGQLARGEQGAPIVQALAGHAPTWLIQLPSLVKVSQREPLHREILGATRERMLREICETLESLTLVDPLMLVFEDLQWVDPSTLDLISALARRRGPAKLAVVATYRPMDAALAQSPLKILKRDLQLHDLCEGIALEPLHTSDVAQYLAAKFASEAPEGLAELVHRHSGGNPLFMIAIVDELRKKGWITGDDRGWKLVTPIENLDPGIPETLQQMVDAQFDALSAQEQSVLRVASVAGERFSTSLVASVLDFAPEHTEDICEALAQRRQFIRSASSGTFAGGATRHYEFTHALYRDGIYRGLSRVIRSRVHRSVGEKLALRRAETSTRELAAELARHFELGHDHERAIEYLIEAAGNAGGRFAYRESIRILQHSLALVASLPSEAATDQECRIHELIGDTHYTLGAMAESAKSYEVAVALAAQDGLNRVQVAALSALVRPLGLIDPSRGIAAIERAAKLSQRLDDPVLAARTRLLAATTRLLYDTWREEDAAICVSAYEAICRAGDSDRSSYEQMLYGHVRVLQGDYGQAIAMFDHESKHVDGGASPIPHFFALSGKTVALLRWGRFGEVLTIVREGKQGAAKNGNDPWLFNFREAWLRLLAFDFNGARALCEGMVARGAEYPTEQPRAIARVSEGCAALDLGDSDRAINCFRQVADPETTGKFFLHWIWRLTAQLGLVDARLARGELANARDACDVFAVHALATSDPYFRAVAWEAKARVAMAGIGWEEAGHHIDQALSALEGFEVPMAAWQVHATAREWHAQVGDARAAEAHRAAAEKNVFSIANSFAADEPLRKSLLSAMRIRKLLAPVSGGVDA